MASPAHAALASEKAALAARRDMLAALMAQLQRDVAAPGSSEARLAAIRSNVASVERAQAAVAAQMRSVDARLASGGAAAWEPPASWVGLTALGMGSSLAAHVFPRYCAWRHHRRPYSARQLELRGALLPGFPRPAAARLPMRLFNGFTALAAAQTVAAWCARPSTAPFGLEAALRRAGL